MNHSFALVANVLGVITFVYWQGVRAKGGGQ